MNNKKWFYGIILSAVLLMTVGYAAMSQLINVEGTAGTDAEWKVLFTDIAESDMNGATSVTSPVANVTTVSFDVNLHGGPGSSAIYEITVSNQGTLNAVLDSITGLSEANQAEPIDLEYSIMDIQIGDRLDAGQSKTFRVKANWDADSNEILETSKQVIIGLNYVQNTQ